MSRDRLAEAVGVQTPAIARVERGERFATHNLETLAKALSVEVRELFSFGDPVPQPLHLSQEATQLALLIDRAKPRQPELVSRLLRALRIILAE